MVSDPAFCVAPLFVPGSRPDRFAKAAASEADAVIIDLEDSVPAADKASARAAAAREAGRLGVAVIVRVNAIETPWHEADCAALAGAGLSGLMLPKAESPSGIADLSKRFGNALPIIPLIETAKGLAAIQAIAEAPSVCRLAFGSIDFALDLGCRHDKTALLHARSELVWRSRAHGLAAPLDGVTADLDDLAQLDEDAAHAASLGLGGKMAVHPVQAGPIKRAFHPTDEDLAWAERVLASAFSAGGAGKVDGQMVDRPIVERARRLLDRQTSV